MIFVRMISITIDLMFRYTAICHPLKPSLHSGKRRTIYIILAIWIICMVPSAWWLIYGKVRISKYRTYKYFSLLYQTYLFWLKLF